MAPDGTWSTPVTIAEPGDYRVFADFKRDGENRTLARDLTVAGAAEQQPLPAPAPTAVTASGYSVHIAAGIARPGQPTALAFHVTRDGLPVAVQNYLGAKGHLVALRAGDLAYLHTHPAGHEGHGGAQSGHGDHSGHGTAHLEAIAFETEFPSAGSYRLFLQFKHAGNVHTAEFTHVVAE
jgi:hypothetical protein